MLARCNGASINSLTESVQSVAENETSEPILYLEWQRKPWLSSCIRRSLWISWSYPFLSGVLPQQTWGLPSGGCWPLREVHAWLCCASICFCVWNEMDKKVLKKNSSLKVTLELWGWNNFLYKHFFSVKIRWSLQDWLSLHKECFVWFTFCSAQINYSKSPQTLLMSPSKQPTSYSYGCWDRLYAVFMCNVKCSYSIKPPCSVVGALCVRCK